MTREFAVFTSQLLLCCAPSVSQSVFTITEKAPTWAFSWLKAPSRGLLRDCENFAEGSLAALLPELDGGGGVGDLVADSDTSHFTFSILAVLGCVTSGSSDHLI